MSDLKLGIDYYLDEFGRFVFTAEYHLKRGYCCKSGCRHCPYGFNKNAEHGNQPGKASRDGSGTKQNE